MGNMVAGEIKSGATSGGGAWTTIRDDSGNITYVGGNPQSMSDFYKRQLDTLESIKNGDYSSNKVASYNSMSSSDGYTGWSILNGQYSGTDIDETEAAIRKKYEAALKEEQEIADFRNGAKVVAKPVSTGQTTTSDTSKKDTTSTTKTTTPTNTIKLNEEKINTFINKIETAIDMLNSTWNNLVMTDVQKINDSWASNDAKTYVDKLMAEGDKISDVVLALKLLEDTYKKVIEAGAATGQDVGSSVGKL